LRSMHDRLDLREVEDIYLPLSPAAVRSMSTPRLRPLSGATPVSWAYADRKLPYIIGVAGSVAVGKSTTRARAAGAADALVARGPRSSSSPPTVFLFPNAVLERQGLMQKKGFPESYDLPTACCRFLSDIKAGRRKVRAPVYSHMTYDIVSETSGSRSTGPDILIVEGVNVLADRSAAARRQGGACGLRLLRLLCLYRRRGRPVLAQLVHPPLPGAARYRVPRSPLVFPSLRAALRRGSHRPPAIAIWERTNLAQSRGQYSCRRGPRATLILEKERRSFDRDRRAAAALI